jgi:hypothetical protein
MLPYDTKAERSNAQPLSRMIEDASLELTVLTWQLGMEVKAEGPGDAAVGLGHDDEQSLTDQWRGHADARWIEARFTVRSARTSQGAVSERERQPRTAVAPFFASLSPSVVWHDHFHACPAPGGAPNPSPVGAARGSSRVPFAGAGVRPERVVNSYDAQCPHSPGGHVRAPSS